MLVAAFGFWAGTAHAQDETVDRRLPGASVHEELLRIRAAPREPAVSLQVTFYSPGGPGPFPLAVMNHGATKASATDRGERYRFTLAAYYFLSRGYAVAMPMMRGFASSGGELAHDGCDVATTAKNNAEDISAVIASLVARPDIDRTRIVVAGQSFGGWNSLGVNTSPPPGVRGIVGFNPAIRWSDCPAQDAAMQSAAGLLGAQAKLPSLWFYGENDTVMPTRTWRNVFDRYKRAGTGAELVDIGAFGQDSHEFLSSPLSLPLWAPKVDGFLARIGLPSAIAYPAYLPLRPPPPSGYAGLTDVAAVPYLDESGRAGYRKFLAASAPRAFVIAPNGAAAFVSSGYDPLGFALRQCARANARCAPYAVDDAVVWAGARPSDAPVEAGQPRLVSRTIRMNTSTKLAGFMSVNPDCSSRGLATVSIVQAPAHGTVQVAVQSEKPTFPPGSPLFACNAAPVPAMGVTYTPAPGFTGADVLTIEEVTPLGKRQDLRIALTVM